MNSWLFEKFGVRYKFDYSGIAILTIYRQQRNLGYFMQETESKILILWVVCRSYNLLHKGKFDTLTA